MPTSTAVVFSKVRSNDLQSPEAAAFAAYLLLLLVPTLKLLDYLLMTALLHTAQASVRAMIFDFGREVGLYSALRLELRTMMCGSLR